MRMNGFRTTPWHLAPSPAPPQLGRPADLRAPGGEIGDQQTRGRASAGVIRQAVAHHFVSRQTGPECKASRAHGIGVKETTLSPPPGKTFHEERHQTQGCRGYSCRKYGAGRPSPAAVHVLPTFHVAGQREHLFAHLGRAESPPISHLRRTWRVGVLARRPWHDSGRPQCGRNLRTMLRHPRQAGSFQPNTVRVARPAVVGLYCDKRVIAQPLGT